MSTPFSPHQPHPHPVGLRQSASSSSSSVSGGGLSINNNNTNNTKPSASDVVSYFRHQRANSLVLPRGKSSADLLQQQQQPQHNISSPSGALIQLINVHTLQQQQQLQHQHNNNNNVNHNQTQSQPQLLLQVHHNRTLSTSSSMSASVHVEQHVRCDQLEEELKEMEAHLAALDAALAKEQTRNDGLKRMLRECGEKMM
eukprot:PhM_4_TR17461/c3_g1_i1/m.85763